MLALSIENLGDVFSPIMFSQSRTDQLIPFCGLSLTLVIYEMDLLILGDDDKRPLRLPAQNIYQMSFFHCTRVEFDPVGILTGTRDS